MRAINIFSLISQLFEKKTNSIAVDTRASVDKAKDYYYGEDISLPTGDENKRIKKLPFKAYDQGGTSACGAFSAAHMRKLTDGNDTDPLPWYRARTNFAGQGMFIQEVLKSAALADIMPLVKRNIRLTEDLANSYAPTELFKNSRKDKFEYFQIEPYDEDAVWRTVSLGIPTLITFFATNSEWDEEVVLKDVTTLWTAPVRHYVVALPYSNHMHDGHEWVSVIDSAPNKGYSLRHVRMDFLAKRMYLGGGFFTASTTKKSKVTSFPVLACEYGQRNINVTTLQTFLNQLGLVSKEHITGYYGNITAKAVLNWQLKNISSPKLTDRQLIDWEGKNWGPASINFIKANYK